MEQNQKKGITKIVSGLLLMALGVVGFLFGKNAKSAIVRSGLIIASAFVAIFGAYLFVTGVSEIAIGQIGTYKLNGPKSQGSVYKSPEHFKRALAMSINPVGDKVDPTIKQETRRLHYACENGSNEFTIYFTKFGIFNVPSHDVLCTDGTKLLTYQMR